MKTRSIVIAAGVVAGVAAAAAVVVRRGAPPAAPAVTLGREERQRLLFAVENAFEATLRAYEVSDETSDFEARDARAGEAATALSETVDALRPELGPLAASCAQFVELVSAAQLQLMAYAINRKNRGTPDSAALATETEERRSFKRDAGPVFDGILTALR